MVEIAAGGSCGGSSVAACLSVGFVHRCCLESLLLSIATTLPPELMISLPGSAYCRRRFRPPDPPHARHDWGKSPKLPLWWVFRPPICRRRWRREDASAVRRHGRQSAAALPVAAPVAAGERISPATMAAGLGEMVEHHNFGAPMVHCIRCTCTDHYAL
ncbi:hypothetical protein ACLOJK_007687 [Asimina triloba]